MSKIGLTYQAIGLLWSGTSSGAEQMTTFARLRSETPALMTLRTAIDLGEFLAILRSLTPTTCRAGLVAGRAVTLGLVELVVVEKFGTGPGDDLLPLDGLDVAQVVVV